jgi:hypothetical protein
MIKVRINNESVGVGLSEWDSVYILGGDRKVNDDAKI